MGVFLVTFSFARPFWRGRWPGLVQSQLLKSRWVFFFIDTFWQLHDVITADQSDILKCKCCYWGRYNPSLLRAEPGIGNNTGNESKGQKKEKRIGEDKFTKLFPLHGDENWSSPMHRETTMRQEKPDVYLFRKYIPWPSVIRYFTCTDHGGFCHSKKEPGLRESRDLKKVKNFESVNIQPASFCYDLISKTFQ